MKEEHWFEDYVPGVVHEFRSTKVDEEEIIAPPRQLDPQPFHLVRRGNWEVSIRGLVANSCHAANMTKRFLYDHYLSVELSLGSTGIDELR